MAPKSRGVCFATFSGDLAPALLTLGADVDIAGPSGKRTIPLEKLYIGFARQDVPVTETQGDGKFYLSLRPGEIVTGVRAQNTAGLRSAYDKIRIRRSIEYPVAGVAVALQREGDRLTDLRVAFNWHQSPPRAAGQHQRALRRPARRARQQGLDALVCANQIMPMKTTFTPGHYRRCRRGAGAAAGHASVYEFEAGPAWTISANAGPTTRSPISSTPTSRSAAPARSPSIDPDRSLSYGDLQARSIRFANALRALGLEPENRVALLLHAHRRLSRGVLGHVRAGSIALPLNTFLTVPQ